MANGDLNQLANAPGIGETRARGLAESLSGISQQFTADTAAGAVLKGLTSGAATQQKLSADEQKAIRVQKLQRDVQAMKQQQQEMKKLESNMKFAAANQETFGAILSSVATQDPDIAASTINNVIKNDANFQRFIAENTDFATISNVTPTAERGTFVMSGVDKEGNPIEEVFNTSTLPAGTQVRQSVNQLVTAQTTKQKFSRALVTDTQGNEKLVFINDNPQPGEGFVIDSQGNPVDESTLELSTLRQAITGSQRVTQLSEQRTPTQETVSGEIQTAFGSTLEQARQIPTQEFNLDRIEQGIRGGANTGPAAGVMTFINSLGAQAGIDVNLGGGSSLEQVRSAANELIIPKVKALGSRPSDKDLQFVTDAAANAGKSIEANLEYIDAQRQLNSRLASHAAIIRENSASSGVEIDNILRQFDESTPFTPRDGKDIASELGIDLQSFDVRQDIRGAVPTTPPSADIEAAKKRLGL